MFEHVAAILPAAGMSRRMGRCKQLLDIGGRPAVVRSTETVIFAGVAEIVIVTGGPRSGDIADAVRHLPVKVAHNDSRDSDMAASIRIALSAVSPDTDAVLVFVPDHPLISVPTCRVILEHYIQEPGAIVVPTFQGRKGHPPLFPRALLEELAELPTLRHIMHRHKERIVLLETADPGVVQDMDTPDDYRRVLEIFHRHPIRAQVARGESGPD